jgi:hypothetical protein
MRLTPALTALMLACAGGAEVARAQQVPAALTKVPEYLQATAAMGDKLPEVAVVKLQRLLAAGKLKPDQLIPVRLLLTEALVRTGNAAEAAKVSAEPAVLALPEGKFWQAQTLARLNRWQEAEALFAQLAPLKDFRYAVETAFSRAGLLAALGDPDRATEALQPLRQDPASPQALKAGLWLAELRLASGQLAEAEALLKESALPAAAVEPERPYLMARLSLAKGEAAAAATAFEGLAANAAAPARLQQLAKLGRARALRQEGKNEEALPMLRQLLSAPQVPPAEILDAAFLELEALNQTAGAEQETFLKALATNAEPALKIRARIALAAAMETVADPRQADEAWAAIPKEFPEHPLRAVALLRHAQFLTGQNRRGEAVPLLEELRQLSPSPAVAAWTAWVSGQGAYDAAAYRKAASQFLTAATTSTDPAIRAAAAYNAALSELQAGSTNPARSLSLLDSSPVAEYRMAGAEFHLERALRMASRGDAAAIDGLQAFADNLPDHPRHFDALIALAEIALRASPPAHEEATRHLAAAQKAAVLPWQLERAALLDCYVAEATPGPAAVSGDAFAAKVEKFLTTFPQSTARSDLRMKAAQLYYRRENYSGARKLFEALEADDSLHPLAEAALFWAGRAALLTMEPTADQQAVVLWEKVYERNGPLKWQARLQEALLNQRQRRNAAALQLLDDVLTSVTGPLPDASTRWQALSLRGEILAAPGMTPEEQAQGLKALDQVIASEGLPAAWKRQTLVRKGVCLEALKRPGEALEAYYDVLSDPPVPGSGAGENAPDDYWFHRAGNKALVMMEQAGKIEEAIEIAKKLAKAPGPRGRAAAELVDELALKYKIWTSSP